MVSHTTFNCLTCVQYSCTYRMLHKWKETLEIWALYDSIPPTTSLKLCLVGGEIGMMENKGEKMSLYIV